MKSNMTTAKRSLRRRQIQRFCKNRMAVAGLIVLAVLLIMCVGAPLFTAYDPNFINPAIRGLKPSAEHLLGTDRVGRDIFARLLYGGRLSILISVVSAVGATMLGAVLGCVAGYYGGKTDKALVTMQEYFSTIPQVLLMLLCIAFVSRGIVTMIAIFILTGWAGMMRVVRSRVLSLKQEPFVESCRANGIPGLSIMFHHILPNTMGSIIVTCTLNVAGFILSEAGLSFIGMGVPETTATWGNIINAAKRIDIVQNMPMLWLAPGIAICLFVLSVNFVGDGLRDALDPSAL